MIAGGKSYPATKNSGIGWIGEVPTHWEVSALRNRYEQCLGKMLDTKRGTGEHLMPYLRNVDVQWDRINLAELPQIDIRPEEVERYTLRPGDLLVCEGGEMGRSAIWMGEIEQCAFQKALHRLRPRQKGRDRPRFVLHALRVAVERGAFYDGHESTIGHLTGEKLRAHRFPFPPETEQRSIEVFLDHTNQRIQRYIEAKENLIALLEEQRQAIIHEAVTGRIDVRTGRPYRTYKTSGSEWLEQLPAHWEVRRLKSLVVRIDQGVSPQAENRLADDTSWGVLKAGCVNGGVFREAEHKRLPQEFVVDPVLAVRTGDVLVSRASGSPRFVGSVGRIRSLDHRLILSDKTFRPIFSHVVDPDFMVLTMNCRYYRQQVEQAISGAEGLANNLPLSSLKSFRFAVPSIVEQQSIVDYLQHSTGQLAAAIAIAEREIGLLNELSATVIANAVSGKVYVCEAAAGLTEMDTLDHGERDKSEKHSSPRRRVDEFESTTENV